MDRKQCFVFREGETISVKIRMSSRRSFVDGVEIPSKVRECKDCLKSENETRGRCPKQKYQHKEWKADIYDLKREPPNQEIENRPMLPHYAV